MVYVSRKGLKAHVLPLALPDDYVEHGSIQALREETGIDVKTMMEKMIRAYRRITDGEELL